TRSDRDWSSDVCSSDLKISRTFLVHFINKQVYIYIYTHIYIYTTLLPPPLIIKITHTLSTHTPFACDTLHAYYNTRRDSCIYIRSEERRVGKECKYRI